MKEKRILRGRYVLITKEDADRYKNSGTIDWEKKQYGETIDLYLNRLNVAKTINGYYPNLTLEEAIDEIEFKSTFTDDDSQIYALLFRQEEKLLISKQEYKRRKEENRIKKMIR